MCDEAKLKEWARGVTSRREFGVLAGVAAVAACAPSEVAAGGEAIATASLETTETGVTFSIGDATMDAFFVHPAEGKHPAVIFWPDIASLREAKRNMARRLAGAGYAVLMLNPYYRDVAGDQFEDFADFFSNEGFATVSPWREKHTVENIATDTKAAVAWLDEQEAVDTSRGIGVQGYCMGGPLTVWSTAAAPERIKAGASFHGGGLVRGDDPNSPHNMLEQADAAYLIAIAQDDHEKAPDHKILFAKAAGRAARPANIDVYEGDHGWTVPDSPAYNEAAAEKAYADLITLYGEYL